MKRSREFPGTARVDNATRLSQTDVAFLKERARIRAVNDEKTARLRALRLEKEARERDAAAAAHAAASAAQELVAKRPRRRKAQDAKDVPAPAVADAE